MFSIQPQVEEDPACWTQSRRLMEVLARSNECDLRQQIQFLKAESEILHSRQPKAVRLTASERSRLIRLGRPLADDAGERPELLVHDRDGSSRASSGLGFERKAAAYLICDFVQHDNQERPHSGIG